MNEAQAGGDDIKELLPPRTELLPIRVSTRIFTQTTSLEWKQFGASGLAEYGNSASSALTEGEMKMSNEYTKNLDVVSCSERRINYTSSFVPYNSRNRVGFFVFSPATSADRAAMLGLDYTQQPARPFLHMETKSLELIKVNSLLSEGYPVISATRPNDDALLFVGEDQEPLTEAGMKRIKRVPDGVRSGKMLESIDMANGAVLWQPEVINNDEFMTALAKAYIKLMKFKPEVIIQFPVNVSSTLGADSEKTLIAQALMHMKGSHFDWHSFGSRQYPIGGLRLAFSNNQNEILRQDQAISQAPVSEVVDIMKECFSEPWPIAHQKWVSLKAKIS